MGHNETSKDRRFPREIEGGVEPASVVRVPPPQKRKTETDQLPEHSPEQKDSK
jgi:hypothetical protein